MRIACLGAGPAGLYFAISMKVRNPAHDIVVIERNKPDDTFGWGVVLSEETLTNLRDNDPLSAAAIRDHFAYWDDIAVWHQGERIISTGHGFCGIGRKKLLLLLQDRARELGVELLFETTVDDLEAYMRDYDLVVGADGINSRTRQHFEAHFQPQLDVRQCKFVWLGTRQKFNDAFTFIFENTKHGWVWAHAYQFDSDTATFIVECSQATYDAFGFAKMSQEQSIARCEEIFAQHLGGHELISNARHLRGSAWLNFTRVLCQQWSYKNVVLLGDASATAHFSIGSGTKLAVESAIALAELLHTHPSLRTAFAAYQSERRLDVLRLQSAARNSTEWFEQIERYLDMPPVQFNYALLTRSQRINHENLRARDPNWLADAEIWFNERCGGQGQRAPMFTPFKLRDLHLPNRVVVSPMAQYKATDGMAGDWHLVHYGERAKGGAGLVMTEMICVSAEGRITPGCTGLYADNQAGAWKRIVDFVHGQTDAYIAAQIGHSGRKGSTQVGWETMDAPLEEGNWPLLSASPLPWSEANATPTVMSRDDMDTVTAQFVSAAERAADAGFDLLEVHGAHGYLLASFLSPLTNIRTDEYGGSLENRLRYPIEVVTAVRRVWPAHKPLSVRISANDWVGETGMLPHDAVEVAAALRQAGADLCNVSAGQTDPSAHPTYGRMFQTPFSDQIRNETGMPTMTAGNIYTVDHVNSIVIAGRADLVSLGRPHLSNPYWTLHAAATLGHGETRWPKPYLAGGEQLARLTERNERLE